MRTNEGRPYLLTLGEATTLCERSAFSVPSISDMTTTTQRRQPAKLAETAANINDILFLYFPLHRRLEPTKTRVCTNDVHAYIRTY